MLPAPKGGSRSCGTTRTGCRSTLLQCCPPRRAGVGPQGSTTRSLPQGFNAARPEGRESGWTPGFLDSLQIEASMLPAPKGGSRIINRDPQMILHRAASMLPAPKGGSRGTPVGPPLILDLRFNAARPEGRESVVLLGSGERVGAASMLPAPKGGSRVDPWPQPG